MPCRYCRMSTTRSSAVRATTRPRGEYPLPQYSGMTVPLGSPTRSTRTVYQGFRARYSLDSTFQGWGSSSLLTAGMLLLDQAARPGENGAHPQRCQLAGVGVLPARVVAAEQHGKACSEPGLAAVSEGG